MVCFCNLPWVPVVLIRPGRACLTCRWDPLFSSSIHHARIICLCSLSCKCKIGAKSSWRCLLPELELSARYILTPAAENISRLRSCVRRSVPEVFPNIFSARCKWIYGFFKPIPRVISCYYELLARSFQPLSIITFLHILRKSFNLFEHLSAHFKLDSTSHLRTNQCR